jgi:hypothetical protein
MSRLTETAAALRVPFETSESGRWIRFPSDCGQVYVAEGHWENNYVLWCDCPDRHIQERYMSPEEAVQAGIRWLSRAA